MRLTAAPVSTRALKRDANLKSKKAKIKIITEQIFKQNDDAYCRPAKGASRAQLSAMTNYTDMTQTFKYVLITSQG